MVQSIVGRVALFFLRVLAWGYAFLPPPLRLFFGRLLGDFLRLLGMRSKVVAQNLEIAFPGNDFHNLQYRKKLFIESYRHLGNLFLEILMLFGPMKWFVSRNGELKGLENWKKAHAQKKGVIFVSSHLGNWEVMAAIGAHYGMDLMLVTKHLKPEWIHKGVEEGRLSCSVLATYEPKTFRDVLRHLKDGHTVGIVLDQYAGAPIGVRVPFFGVPVGTANIISILAKRTGSVVLPAHNYRLPDGRFCVELGEPLEWIEDIDPQRELARNTARYVSVLEEFIRKYPQQWLWTHRRFKGDLSPLREGEWEEGRARK